MSRRRIYAETTLRRAQLLQAECDDAIRAQLALIELAAQYRRRRDRPRARAA